MDSFSFGQAAQSAILAGYEASAAAYLSAAQAVQARATAAVTAAANMGSSVLASAMNIGASLYTTTHAFETRSAYQSLLTSAVQVSEARRVFDFAVLSALVYESAYTKNKPIDDVSASSIELLKPYSISSGWRSFDWSSIDASTGISPETVSSAMGVFKHGLEFNIFYNETDLVIAFKGTLEVSDLIADLGISLCANPQYIRANDIYKSLIVAPAFVEKKKNRKLILTGHSLGGGIAAYIAAHNLGLEVVAFNPAPLCTKDAYDQFLALPGYSNGIRNIAISGEILTAFIFVPPLQATVFRVGDSVYYPNPYLLSITNQVDSHKMAAVLFSLDSAKNIGCSQVPCTSNSSALTASLSGNASISTSSAPFRAAIRLLGTGLTAVERITWKCMNVGTGAACAGSPYMWEKSTAPERFQFSDTEALLDPVVITSGDKEGSYRWEVVLSTSAASTPPITVTVQYAPPVFNPAALRPLSIPGQVISTGGSSVLTFNFSGTQFDAVQSIEWAWSGASSGPETWVRGSAEWNANVSIAPDGSITVRRPVASSIAAAGGRTEWRISLVSDQGVRATRLFGLTATPSPGNTPNLVVQNINFSPIGVDPGGAVQVNFAVTNLGTATAAASIAAVRINQSSNSEAGLNLGASSVPSLAVGASFPATAIANAPATLGTYRVWVIAGNGDTAGPINAVSTTGTLTVVGPPQPPPTITSVSVNPTSPVAGALATFSVNGTNLRAGYAISFPGCAATEIASTSTTIRQFTCTLTQAGTALAGNVMSASGALLGSFTLTVAPPPPPSAGARIATGFGHACAITTNGGVKCWGVPIYVGDGGIADARLTPVDVIGLSSGVVAIAAGEVHTCALTALGGVKCWGDNFYGQLGDGTTTLSLTPVDVVGLSSGVVAIAADRGHTCALMSLGGVKCWGWNDFGQLGDGSVISRLTPVQVVGLSTGVASIAVGYGHTCASLSFGGVKCWGWNTNRQIGDVTDIDRLTPVFVFGVSDRVVSMAAGGNHTCVVTNAGAVKCWGDGSFGQLGDGQGFIPDRPVDVVGLGSGVAIVGVGGSHSCAQTSAGAMRCWGYNAYGQIGDDTVLDRFTPSDVFGLGAGVAGVSGGSYFTCALMTLGGVKCWGDNWSGQLGDGTTTQRLRPVDVVGF